MENKLNVSLRRFHTVFTQHIDGWSNSGFERQLCSMKVRRVIRNDRDEAQIEIEILETKKSGRVYQHMSSLTVPADQISKLIDALTKTRDELESAG